MKNKDKVIYKLEIELYDDVYFDHCIGCYYFLDPGDRSDFIEEYKKNKELSLNGKLNYHYVLENNVFSNLKKEMTIRQYEELFGVEL